MYFGSQGVPILIIVPRGTIEMLTTRAARAARQNRFGGFVFMFELRPFERRNNHIAAYDPWDQMERAFFGDGSWARGLSEFKTDIQDKGDSYLAGS
jgi:hypothetical protein